MPHSDLLTVLGFSASSNQSHAHFAWLPVSGSLRDAIARCVKTFITAFREFRLQALCLGNARTTAMNVLLGNKYPQCLLVLVRCQTRCDASMIITRTPRTVTCVTMETRKNVLKPQGSPLCKLNCHVPHAACNVHACDVVNICTIVRHLLHKSTTVMKRGVPIHSETTALESKGG